MRRIGYRLFLTCLLTLFAIAPVGAELRHGINITNWFRFPPSKDPAALRAYLDDTTIETLRRAGFDFVRLLVQPELLPAAEAIGEAIGRLERHGFAVLIVLAPTAWQLETSANDRLRLLSAWHALAKLLHRFDPARTYPEVLNEPVFARDPSAWRLLQHQALTAIRAELPQNTIVLTGADWGSIGGLLALAPEPDPNVLYSFHFYEPPELTALGAYRPGLDSAAMARLPFPGTNPDCASVAQTTGDFATAGLIRFFCEQGWDSAKLETHIAEASTWALRNHVRVIAGEFGASSRLNSAARETWLSSVRDACERRGIPWALWGYDDSMGFDEHPPRERLPLSRNVLRALGLVQ